MWFNRNKISYTQIICESGGISEADKLMNYAAGHMMGGFEGMVQADILNESEGPSTTFLVVYENGAENMVTVLNSSRDYKKYIGYLK